MATRTRRNDRPLGDWRTYYEQIWKPMSDCIKPPYDRMPLKEFAAARKAVMAQFPEPTCRSCTDFEMGLCKQFGEVPVEFQLKPEACESWRLDFIPFDAGHRP